MANKFLSGINVTGTTTLNTVANAGTDTDKFLVLDASGNVDFRTGAELYADLGIGALPSGFTSTLKHVVKAGVALTKGQAVYVTDADGTNMIVGKASNAAEATSSKTMGLIETSLSINGIGNVITEGLLAGLDTTAANATGDPVWLGTDGNLIYGLINKPYAPANLVFIGVVTRINANNGEIFVKVQNGFELNELHDVDLKTTTPINGHILGYNGTLWVNKTIAGWLGYTPSNDTNVVHLAGTETITGAKTFSLAVSAHEGIAFLNGVMPPITSSYYSGIGGNSEGISIVTRPVSTNYTNNLYFPSASNSYTFPNATGTIALTSNLSAYVPTSRTLTINGVAYDLSADRAWTIEAGGGTSASTRTIQKFTSTASQTTFTITGGYTVGMVDVWVNGVKLDNAVDFTASNGTTVVLTDALTANQIVEVYKYGSQFIINNGLRQKTLFTATAGQTTFTVAYSVGLVDVYYNGSKLDDSDFTATNGTSIVLGTACAVNDKVEVIAFSYNVNGFTGIGGSGTTNNLPKFTAAGTIGDSAITDNGTTVTLVSRALSGTSATFSGNVNIGPTTTGFDSVSQIASSNTGNIINALTLQNTSNTETAGTGVNLNFGGKTNWLGRISTQFVGGTGGGDASMSFLTPSGGTLVTRLTIASTGAATFSSSVTATTSLIATSADTLGTNINIINSSSGGYNWNIFSGGSSNTLGPVGSLIFRDSTNGATRMVISPSGSVGIGTSSPSFPLTVGQAGSTADSYIQIGSTTTGTGNIFFGDATGGIASYSGYIQYQHSANAMLFATDSTERMRITSGGDVGIGNTGTSGHRLAVKGGGNTSGSFAVVVTNSSNTDLFFIRNDGYMYFGLEPNSPYNIAQSGRTCILASNGTVGYLSSTRESKTNIENLSDISWLYQLNPVSFNYRKKDEENNYTNEAEDDKWYGLIADEVESVNEYLVFYKTKEDKTKELAGVEYNKLIAALVKSVQELKAEIEILKQK